MAAVLADEAAAAGADFPRLFEASELVQVCTDMPQLHHAALSVRHTIVECAHALVGWVSRVRLGSSSTGRAPVQYRYLLLVFVNSTLVVQVPGRVYKLSIVPVVCTPVP